MDELYEERLNDETHFIEVADFTCGIYDPLNNYLKSEAFDYNRRGIGNTFLLFNSIDKKKRDIVCYYTLRASSLSVKNEFIPVIEISKFAVNISYQRKGIGSACILNVILNKIMKIKEYIGVVNILVFAETKESLSFYKSIGFVDYTEKVQNIDEILIIDDGFADGCNVLLLDVSRNLES